MLFRYGTIINIFILLKELFRSSKETEFLLRIFLILSVNHTFGLMKKCVNYIIKDFLCSHIKYLHLESRLTV